MHCLRLRWRIATQTCGAAEPGDAAALVVPSLSLPAYCLVSVRSERGSDKAFVADLRPSVRGCCLLSLIASTGHCTASVSCAGFTYWSTWRITIFDTVQRAKSGLGEPLNGTSLEGKGGKAHSILASHGRKNSITGVTKRHPSMPLMPCTGARSAPACSGADLWRD